MSKDINIMVAGAAGQGMQTIGAILGKVFVRGGCEVFAMQDNESRIRGGHNFFQIRVSHKPARAASMPLHVLIALNQQSVEKHSEEVAPEGVILFDSEEGNGAEEEGRFLGLPLERLALEEGGNKIFSNSAALGVTLAILGWDFRPLEDFHKEYLAAKADMLEGNIRAARAGYESAQRANDKYSGPRILPKIQSQRCLSPGMKRLPWAPWLRAVSLCPPTP